MSFSVLAGLVFIAEASGECALDGLLNAGARTGLTHLAPFLALPKDQNADIARSARRTHVRACRHLLNDHRDMLVEVEDAEAGTNSARWTGRQAAVATVENYLKQAELACRNESAFKKFTAKNEPMRAWTGTIQNEQKLIENGLKQLFEEKKSDSKAEAAFAKAALTEVTTIGWSDNPVPYQKALKKPFADEYLRAFEGYLALELKEETPFYRIWTALKLAILEDNSRYSLQVLDRIDQHLGAMQEDVAEIKGELKYLRASHDRLMKESQDLHITIGKLIELVNSQGANVQNIDEAIDNIRAVFARLAERENRHIERLNIDEHTKEILAELNRLLDEKNVDQANTYIESELEKFRVEKERRRAEERGRQAAEDQAEIEMLRGSVDVAYARFDAKTVANREIEIIKLLENDATSVFQAIESKQDDFFERALRIGALIDMDVAEELARAALETAPDEYSWAVMQSALGKILCIQGQSGRVEALAEAERAFHSATSVCTKTSYPDRWALIQNDLSIVYSTYLRIGFIEFLAKGELACRNALTVWTEDQYPVEWSRAHTNLGNILMFKKEEQSTSLKGAESSYRKGLKFLNKEFFPVEWATIKYNLGYLYNELLKQGDVSVREEAAKVFLDALSVLSKEKNPVDWAKAKTNLGNYFQLISKLGFSDETMKALVVFEEAAEVFSEDSHPHSWATIQNNIANVYLLRTYQLSTNEFDLADNHLRAALSVFDRSSFPADWAMVTLSQGMLHGLKWELNGSETQKRLATSCVDGALEAFREVQDRFGEALALAFREKLS